MKQSKLCFFILFVIGSLINIDGYSQMERNKVVEGFLYNLANKITIPGKQISEYNIYLLSGDLELNAELQDVLAKREIQGAKLNIKHVDKPVDELLNAQLIYISKDKLEYYMNVFDMIEGKQILLISDGFDEKSYVMLNLFDTENGSIMFEINRPNIINQHLSISDEVVLLGGSEIDIAEIYLKSQHSLRRLEKDLEHSSTQLIDLHNRIEVSENRIKTQNEQIKLHKETLNNQNKQLEEYMQQINKYSNDLKSAKTSLRSMQDSLIKNGDLLNKRKLEILNSQNFLQKQRIEIDSINSEIEHRNRILADQESIIGKQRNRMNILIAVLIVFLILVALLIILYINNRKKSNALHQQSKKIKAINEELNTNYEKLVETLKQKKQMQEQLVQSEKMVSLGVLSAGIAHEINNPINFVYAGINSLLRDFKDIEPVLKEIEKLSPDDDNLREKIIKINTIKEENYFDDAFEAIPEIISDIQLGADRTSEIVKGLRSFSRSDKEKVVGVNIHEGIDTSLLLLRNRYKNTIEVIKNYDKSLPVIEGYPGKLNQVFLNLLSNAIDAIEDKGQIKIETKNLKDTISITIKDTGTGMNEETKSKIFDPFYTTKTVGQGTGLGLSISYGIVKDHNGTIDVNTEQGKGTEFIITIPKNI